MIKVCPNCKNEFKPRWSDLVYCGKVCYLDAIKNKIVNNCLQCGARNYEPWAALIVNRPEITTTIEVKVI